MNDNHSPLDFEKLEPPLEAAVQAIRSEPLPEDAIDRVKERAKKLAQPSIVTLPIRNDTHDRRWKTSRPILSGLTIAAALLVIVTGLVMLLDRSAENAFAQVIEKVKAARSVGLTMITRFGHQPEMSAQMFLEGNLMRIEHFEGRLIQVGDLDRKLALFLDVQRKLAQSLDIDTKLTREFANPIDQLRNAKSNDAENIGQEILNGRHTNVYRLRKMDLFGIKGSGEMMVWVDVESELPAKIVFHDPDPKAETEIRFEKFVWNVPLDPQLFSLSIPSGFQKGIIMLPVSQPEPTQPNVQSPDASNGLADGVVSRDRVPAGIIWGRQGKTITALLRDAESVPPQNRRPNELRQWDLATGKALWSESIAGAGWVAGTADGKSLATVIGYEVQLRDAASGKVTRKWTTEKPLSPLAFAPDGKTLAAGITEWGPFGGNGGKPSGGVQFWDVERGVLVRSLFDDKPVTFVGYSTNGKYMATSSNDGPVKLWDVANGTLIRIFPGFFRASFSPNGETIACPSTTFLADKTIGRIEIYNLKDGMKVKSFASEKGNSPSTLLSVAFSPDGRLLTASDWNGTVSLWEVATGQCTQVIPPQKAGVISAAFSPDGSTLATGSEDNTLRLWRLPTELIDAAKE